MALMAGCGGEVVINRFSCAAGGGWAVCIQDGVSLEKVVTGGNVELGLRGVAVKGGDSGVISGEVEVFEDGFD